MDSLFSHDPNDSNDSCLNLTNKCTSMRTIWKGHRARRPGDQKVPWNRLYFPGRISSIHPQTKHTIDDKRGITFRMDGTTTMCAYITGSYRKLKSRIRYTPPICPHLWVGMSLSPNIQLPGTKETNGQITDIFVLSRHLSGKPNINSPIFARDDGVFIFIQFLRLPGPKGCCTACRKKTINFRLWISVVASHLCWNFAVPQGTDMLNRLQISIPICLGK